MESPQTGGDVVKVTLHIDGKPVTLENVTRAKGELSFILAGKPYSFRGQCLSDGSAVLERQAAPGIWQRMDTVSWQGKGGVRHVQLGGLEARISELTNASKHTVAEASLSPRAPMPGMVRQILVKPGERVEKGQALAVMEAMKLQMTLSAGAAAKVEAVLVKEGEMIAEGAELVRLKEVK
jgi:acetyl/propionyl-CoA carboxylase alpha subunit